MNLYNPSILLTRSQSTILFRNCFAVIDFFLQSLISKFQFISEYDAAVLHSGHMLLSHFFHNSDLDHLVLYMEIEVKDVHIVSERRLHLSCVL